MKVRHIHPDYDTPEQRRQALLDAKRLCAAALLNQKRAAGEQSA